MSSSPSEEPLLESTGFSGNEQESETDENTLSAYGDVSLTEETKWNGRSLRGSLRPKIPRPTAPSKTRHRASKSELELKAFESIVCSIGLLPIDQLTHGN